MESQLSSQRSLESQKGSQKHQSRGPEFKPRTNVKMLGHGGVEAGGYLGSLDSQSSLGGEL